MDYAVYSQRIKKALDDLEHLDFNVDAVAEFKKAMGIAARHILMSGQDSNKQANVFVCFQSLSVKTTMQCMNMEWDRRFYARAITLALESGQLRFLPWDLLMFPDGIPRARSTIQVPEDLIASARVARDHAMKLLDDASATGTLADCKRILGPRSEALQAIDRHWCLVDEVLTGHVENILTKESETATLNCFPTDIDLPTYDEMFIK